MLDPGFAKSHRTRTTAKVAKYRDENREECRRQWRERDKAPERKILKKFQKGRRRAPTIGAGMVIARHCKGLLESQGWRCAACSADLKLGRHLDHVMPLAAGGRHEVGNFQWLCPPCNLAKGAKPPSV